MREPFDYSPVIRDLPPTRRFYGETPGDREGHSADIRCVGSPGICCEGLGGEQATLFLLDPRLRPLEPKSFRNSENLFRT